MTVEAERTLRVRAHVDALAGLPCEVKRLHVHESLSRPYIAKVRLEVKGLVEPDDLLDQPAQLVASGEGGRTERAVSGIVYRAAVRARPQDRFLVDLEIRPRLFKLSLRTDSRLYTDKSVVEVLEDVLERAGLTDCCSFDLAGTYPAHPHFIQRNETDLAFLHRLCQEEGITYVVRNDIDEELVVFFDDNATNLPIADRAEVPFRRTTSLREEAMLSFAEERVARPDAVSVRDYDFVRPSLDLTSTDEADDSSGREVYTHPGGYVEESDGAQRAARLLERLRLGTHVFRGRSDLVHLEPGRTFDLTGHPRIELDRTYVALDVEHRYDDDGGGVTYENEVLVVVGDTPLRPVDAPAPPEIGGVEVAFVTGPGGAELHGSENGQVKVRFPWDRSGLTDDKSSNWLRVGQLPLPGSMVVPRVGFEVLVDYEMGDVDRPVVIGHLYNGEARPPYELPGGATRSSIQTATTDGGAGANEIRFEDDAGSEEILFNASHDFTCSIESNAQSAVNTNETVTVGANATKTIGSNSAASVTGTRTLTVGGNQTIGCEADLSMGTGGNLTVTVGSRKETVGGDLTEPTTGALTRSVGAVASFTGVAGYARNIVGSSTTTVGAAMAIASGENILSSCGGSRAETVGALKMIKAKAVAVSAGAAYVQTCAVHKVSAGGNRVDASAGAIALTAATIDIKAADITISGESKVELIVGGSSIKVLPSEVIIKSSKVDLKGVKRLESMNHEST